MALAESSKAPLPRCLRRAAYPIAILAERVRHVTDCAFCDDRREVSLPRCGYRAAAAQFGYSCGANSAALLSLAAAVSPKRLPTIAWASCWIRRRWSGPRKL